MTNAKSVINAILMDTVSVICNQLYWIYMTNALSVSEYWMETFVKLLNVLGAEPNEVLKEVIPLTRMEHTSVVEGKLERLTPKKQESVLRMLDVIIEEMMK